MITKTRQDLVDFIKAQPNDKKLNMGEASGQAACGCLLVHFGKSLDLDVERFYCGWNCITNGEGKTLVGFDERTTGLVVSLKNAYASNYGEAKKVLLKLGDKLDK